MDTATSGRSDDRPQGADAVPTGAARYRTIVADPPWNLQYPTMALEAIKALSVATLAATDCHLYPWTTNKYLPDAFDVMRAWGFRYSSTQTWGKALMGGGLGGTWRINCEFFLFGYRGRCDARDSVPGTWFAWGEDDEQDACLFNWKRPYDERGKPRHSAKPPEFFTEVERVSHGPYVELFARERRAGWDAWGNEVDNDLELAA